MLSLSSFSCICFFFTPPSPMLMIACPINSLLVSYDHSSPISQKRMRSMPTTNRKLSTFKLPFRNQRETGRRQMNLRVKLKHVNGSCAASVTALGRTMEDSKGHCPVATKGKQPQAGLIYIPSSRSSISRDEHWRATSQSRSFSSSKDGVTYLIRIPSICDKLGCQRVQHLDRSGSSNMPIPPLTHTTCFIHVEVKLKCAVAAT